MLLAQASTDLSTKSREFVIKKVRTLEAAGSWRKSQGTNISGLLKIIGKTKKKIQLLSIDIEYTLLCPFSITGIKAQGCTLYGVRSVSVSK